MDTQTIERIRRHFIRSSMLAVGIVILSLGFVVNAGQAFTVRLQINETLNYMISHEGRDFLTGRSGSETTQAEQAESETEMNRKEDLSRPLLGYNPFTLERLSNFTYFTVEKPVSGTSRIRMSKEGMIEEEDALEMAEAFLASGSPRGFQGFYFYQYEKNAAGDAFLICIDYQEGVYNLLRLFSWSLVGLILALTVTYLLVRAMSGRIVRPMIENSRRQQQFITNASHELKTPLAVIRSNTELQEMLNGESEWTQSTLKQVDRLNGLVQNLVMIARSQEQESSQGVEDTDISAIIEETAKPFDALAQTEKLQFTRSIAPDIHMVANGSSIRTLTSVLVDNAIKYCDAGGSVHVSLEAGHRGKGCLLSVSNFYAAGENVDYTRFFERFYREDQSHHVDGPEKKGYGIGLSLAQNLCCLYGGTISVRWKDGVITFICPLNSLKK